MTLNIEINALNVDHRIISDAMQIVIQRKHTIDPTKSPTFDTTKHSAEIRTEWRDWKYCGSITQVCDVLLKQRILESDATTLRQLRDEIVAFRRRISDLIGD